MTPFYMLLRPGTSFWCVQNVLVYRIRIVLYVHGTVNPALATVPYPRLKKLTSGLVKTSNLQLIY